MDSCKGCEIHGVADALLSCDCKAIDGRTVMSPRRDAFEGKLNLSKCESLTFIPVSSPQPQPQGARFIVEAAC